MMEDNVFKKVPAVYRVVNVLDYIVRRHTASLTDIHRDLHLAKSSAYVLVQSMADTGLLKKNPDNTYSPGMKLYELGHQAVSHLDIASESYSYLKALRDLTRLTVHLGVAEGTDAIYLSKIDGLQSVIPNTWIGKRLSLYSSSLGKVLLAWMGDNELHTVLSRLTFIPRTLNTISDAQTLLSELKQVRENYVAVDREEDVEGIICFAAPVFSHTGRVIAGVSLSATRNQIADINTDELTATLKSQAFALSRSLGYQGEPY
ncbi:TPA: IclR family transcriptional regulator [Salmonella enterica subsp. enterica serovar Muenchen]